MQKKSYRLTEDQAMLRKDKTGNAQREGSLLDEQAIAYSSCR